MEQTQDDKTGHVLLTDQPTPEQAALIATLALDGPFMTTITVILVKDKTDDEEEQIATAFIQCPTGTLVGTATYLEAIDKALKEAPTGFRVPTRQEFLRSMFGAGENVTIPGPAEFLLDNTVGRA